MSFGLWREVTTNVDGDTAEYGCNDLKLISQLFNGVNNGIPAVLFDNYNGVVFGDYIMGVYDQNASHIAWLRGPTSLTADFEIAIPPITGNDTLAALNLGNVFTQIQRVRRDNVDLMKLSRVNNGVNSSVGVSFLLNNSASAEAQYGTIYASIFDNTAAAESGFMEMNVKRSGTLYQVLTLDRWGRLALGPDSSSQGSVTRNLSRSGTAVSFSNTSAEQTLFSATVTGNTMGPNGVVHLRLFGSIQQNQATATDYTLRIKFGGTTIYQDTLATALAQNAGFYPYMIDIYLFNTNATNAQLMYGFVSMNDTASVTTGLGDITDDESQSNGVISATASTKDTTVDQTFAVTIQMSVANTNVKTFVDYKWCAINPNT